MANVLVRDLPDAVLKVLHSRAKAAGRSLQQYLSVELARLAERPTMEEVLARIRRLRGGRLGSPEKVVKEIGDGRERR